MYPSYAQCQQVSNSFEYICNIQRSPYCNIQRSPIVIFNVFSPYCRLNITALELSLQFLVGDDWSEKKNFMSREIKARALYAEGKFNASAGKIRDMVREFPGQFEQR